MFVASKSPSFRATCKWVCLPLFPPQLALSPPHTTFMHVAPFWFCRWLFGFHLAVSLSHLFAVCFVWHANFAACIEGHVSCGFRSAPVWVWVCVQVFVCRCLCCLLPGGSAVERLWGLRVWLQLGRVPPKFMTTIVSIWLSVCLGLLPLSVWLIKITL